MALFRRSGADDVRPRDPVAAPASGLLRRERRALLNARDERAARPRRPHGRDVPPERLARRPAARALRRGDRDRRPARRDRRAPARQRGHRALHLRRLGAPRLALLPELRPAARRGHRRDGSAARATPWSSRPATTTMAKRRERRGSLAEDDVPALRHARAPEQDYCLECGLRLPVVVGTSPRSAAAGCAASAGIRATGSGSRSPRSCVAVCRRGRGDRPRPQARRGSAAATVRRAAAPRSRSRRPRPAETAERSGRAASTAGRSSSSSSPATHGQTKPLALATGGRTTGLPQVGVLDSSAFASLHPGYYVVFSGVYGAARTTPERRSTPSVHAASAAPTCSASRPE